MNRRIIIGGIIGVVAVVAIAFAAWYVLFGGSAGQVAVSPTPVPTDSSLPSASPIPSTNPIAFRGVCSDTWVGQADSDGDGLPDSVEAIYGTDPHNKDTDGDGYSDGDEVRTGHDPLNPNSSVRLDSDHDGLTDDVECNVWHTDPFNPDSDGDGYTDGAEVKAGFDPTKKGDGHGSDRLPTPTPAGVPTPIATYSPNGNATPSPISGNSGYTTITPPPVGGPTPISGNSGSSGSASITLVPMSQLQITNKTSAADMKTYLASIDSLRPQELSDGTTIVNAITSAANGNAQPLTAARTRIQQFATALRSVPTPQNAAQYQQLYVSLMDFTAKQLLLIEQNAVSNQTVAAQALQGLQSALPSYVSQLQTLRTSIENIANGK